MGDEHTYGQGGQVEARKLLLSLFEGPSILRLQIQVVLEQQAPPSRQTGAYGLELRLRGDEESGGASCRPRQDDRITAPRNTRRPQQRREAMGREVSGGGSQARQIPGSIRCRRHDANRTQGVPGSVG